jgi:hypothetical protein
MNSGYDQSQVLRSGSQIRLLTETFQLFDLHARQQGHSVEDVKPWKKSCQWVGAQECFQTWAKASISSTLLISGPERSGKTHLLAHIVQSRSVTQGRPIPYLYYHFNPDMRHEEIFRDLLINLIHQLFMIDESFVCNASICYESSGREILQQLPILWQIFVTILESLRRSSTSESCAILLALDGLHHLDGLSRQDLSAKLDELVSKSRAIDDTLVKPIKILLADREDSNQIFLPLQISQGSFELSLIIQKVFMAQRAALHSALDQIFETPLRNRLKLPLMKKDSEDPITQLLNIAKSDLLWLDLAVQVLRYPGKWYLAFGSSLSTQNLSTRIPLIPQDLPDLVKQSYEGYPLNEKKKIFRWIILSRGVLQQGLLPQLTNPIPEKHPLWPDSSKFHRLRHPDIALYLKSILFQDEIKPDSSLVTEASMAHYNIGKQCFDYLNETRFDCPEFIITTEDVAEMDHVLRTEPFYLYAALNWYRHLKKGMKHILDLQGEIVKFCQIDTTRSRLWFCVYWNYLRIHQSCPTQTTALHVTSIIGLQRLVLRPATGSAISIYDIDARDSSARTALHLAAKLGCSSAVADLLIHDADVKLFDCYGQSPLENACLMGNENTMKLFLRPGQGSIIFGTNTDHVSSARLILKYASAADVKFEGRDALALLKAFKSNDDLEFIQLYQMAIFGSPVDALNDQNIAHVLSQFDSKRWIIGLLHSVENINLQEKDGNRTPLMAAAIAKNYPALTNFLLVKNIDAYVRDADGRTVAHHSAGWAKGLQLLLSKYPDLVNIEDNGKHLKFVLTIY